MPYRRRAPPLVSARGRKADHRSQHVLGQNVLPNNIREATTQIRELSLSMRTTWFGLITTLAFLSLATFKVKDEDFFSPSRETFLPIISVSIPTASFFWAAPLLMTAVFVYFHFQLGQLWKILGDARQFPGQQIIDGTPAWPVIDFALTWPGRNRAPNRPLTTASNIFTRLLLWLATPIFLIWLWWRSMAAHKERMTIWISFFLEIAIVVGYVSWKAFCAEMERRTTDSTVAASRKRILRVFEVAGAAGILFSLVVTGWLRTEGGFDHQAMAIIDWLEKNSYISQFEKGLDGTDDEAQRKWVESRFLTIEDLRVREPFYPYEFVKSPAVPLWLVTLFPEQFTDTTLAPVHLGDVDFVQRYPDWLDYKSARDKFSQQWCKDRNFALGCAVAEDDWRLFRRAYLLRLGRFDLTNSDLRGADLQRAFLPRAVLRSARLDGARMWETYLEAAELQEAAGGQYESLPTTPGASFARADIWGARLDANLERARFDGAQLSGVDFGSAFLNWASMQDVYMYEVQMDGATLTSATISGYFENSTFKKVNFEKSVFFGTVLVNDDLSSADHLTQAQLVNVIGDETTKLPPGVNIWSCWKTKPNNYEFFARLPQWKAGTGICAAGTQPRAIGRY